MHYDDYPIARVRVLVNVDNLRIGMEDDVELTPRIQGLLASGYLRLIGHVTPPTPAAPPAPVVPPEPPRALLGVVPLAEEEPDTVAPRRTPRKKKVADDAGSESGS